MNQTENNELKHSKATSDSGFTVPDGYFENLRSEIDRKISASPSINHQTRNKWIYATAASIILLLTSTIYFYNLSKKESDLTQKETLLTNIATDSNLDSKNDNYLPRTDATQVALSADNQDIIDDELIATADELNLSDEELVELTEYIDL
jgi:hypothetical protein